MVKLTGPGLAHGATGSLAGELIFSTWKGTPYLKQHRDPKQPRTPGQVAMRAVMQLLSLEWRNLSAADQALWYELADQTNVSPFNAFQALNLARWRSHKAPTQIPTTDTAGYGMTSTGYTVIAVSRGIKFSTDVTDRKQSWTTPVYHLPSSGDPKSWHELLHFIILPATGYVQWIWRPIPPGTYYLCTTVHKIHGQLGTGQINYTVVLT